MENGVSGCHGAMRLTDRAGVVTCSQTTTRMMEWRGGGERERQRELHKNNKATAVKKRFTTHRQQPIPEVKDQHGSFILFIFNQRGRAHCYFSLNNYT